jgi:hypothetical protein
MAKYPYRILGSFFDRLFRNDVNDNFNDIGTDIKEVQSQINKLVVEGDSSPAAAQAAVDANGVDKGNLKKRLDDDYIEVTTKMTQKMNETDVLFKKNGLYVKVNYPTVVQSHLLPINIYNNAGKFTTDFDPRSLKPVRANTYYVNPITGLDTRDGLTKATACKSIAKALSMSGDNQILLADGIYYYQDGWKGVDPTKGVSVICEKGKAVLNNSTYPRNWVEDATYKGVYNAPTVYNVEDLKAVMNDLRFLVKGYNNEQSGGTQITSQPQNVIELGTPGYIIGTDNIKVRLPNNLNPNTYLDIKYALDNVVCKVNNLTDSVIYLENIEAYYGKTSPMILQNSTVNSKVVLINVSGNDSRTTDGIELTCNGQAVLFKCKALRNYQDGFNYYVNKGVSGQGIFDIIEIECEGHLNGKDSTGTNNGTTLHSTARAIRLNCNYEYNQNRNVHDVGGGWSFNVGVTSRFSQTDMEDFCSGLSTLGLADKMWLVGCVANRIGTQTGATVFKEVDSVFAKETGAVSEFNPY